MIGTAFPAPESLTVRRIIGVVVLPDDVCTCLSQPLRSHLRVGGRRMGRLRRTILVIRCSRPGLFAEPV
jgi:hypothetical protein